MLDGGHWFQVKDADPHVLGLYKHHYSAKQRPFWNPRRGGVGGPGERIVLLTTNADALWVWRLYKDKTELGDRLNRKGFPIVAANLAYSGVCCTVFRNTGPILSSTLVKEAMEIAEARWPGKRLFTFVDASEIKSSNPGYCFKVCGWKKVGTTTRNLIILEAPNKSA